MPRGWGGGVGVNKSGLNFLLPYCFRITRKLIVETLEDKDGSKSETILHHILQVRVILIRKKQSSFVEIEFS